MPFASLLFMCSPTAFFLKKNPKNIFKAFFTFRRVICFLTFRIGVLNLWPAELTKGWEICQWGSSATSCHPSLLPKYQAPQGKVELSQDPLPHLASQESRHATFPLDGQDRVVLCPFTPPWGQATCPSLCPPRLGLGHTPFLLQGCAKLSSPHRAALGPHALPLLPVGPGHAPSPIPCLWG